MRDRHRRSSRPTNRGWQSERETETSNVSFYHKPNPTLLKFPIRLNVALAVLAALSLPMAGGCARTPAGAVSQLKRQILVQMTVRGQINPQRHYFFAIDTSNDTSQGPLPTVAPPWGNGWGAGRITYYVQVDAAQPGFYGLYRFDPKSLLQTPTYLGRPIAYSPIENTNTLSFSLSLDDLLDPNGAPAQNLNLNFITTDRIPLDPNDREPKLVDALGRVGNNYISINTQQQRIYQNSQSSEPEASGDVADPDLDIVDWQIEVRNG
jgi:hypothetical protein